MFPSQPCLGQIIQACHIWSETGTGGPPPNHLAPSEHGNTGHITTQLVGTNKSFHITFQYSPFSCSHPGGVGVNPNTRATIMMSGHTTYKARKGWVYMSHYVDSTSAFTEDSKKSMEKSSQVRQLINVLPRTCIHTVLGAHEFRYNVLIRYQARSKNFSENCDGCSSINPFTTKHVLQFKVGGGGG